VTVLGGHKYYATAEHKWPVHLNGRFVKVETQELRSGDYLPLIQERQLFEGNEGSYEEGFLVGWIIGDGWITRRSDTGMIQVG
ncbi:hypothetical protein ACQ7B2_16195, partial [Escherichia coli]